MYSRGEVRLRRFVDLSNINEDHICGTCSNEYFKFACIGSQLGAAVPEELLINIYFYA